MFGLPEAGLLLVLGIDHFLDMGRTVTNVLGNAIATAVVAKWESAIDPVPDELAEADEALPLPDDSPSPRLPDPDCLLRVRTLPSNAESPCSPGAPAPGFFSLS